MPVPANPACPKPTPEEVQLHRSQAGVPCAQHRCVPQSYAMAEELHTWVFGYVRCMLSAVASSAAGISEVAFLPFPWMLGLHSCCILHPRGCMCQEGLAGCCSGLLQLDVSPKTGQEYNCQAISILIPDEVHCRNTLF